MSSCVYQGSALVQLSKMAVTFGTTTTIMTVMSPEPMTIMSAGYASAAPTFPRSFDCDSMKSASRSSTRLERARGLAGAHHAHVERREHAGVRLERLGEASCLR